MGDLRRLPLRGRHELGSVGFHDLRRTAATLMLKERVPVNVVAPVFGHSDPAMTLRRYAHALPDVQGMAAEAMGSYAF